MTKNSYPEKPVVNFVAVPIAMDKINAIIAKSTAPLEVKIAAQIICRNETGNGHSVINGTNPTGTQADSGRWASIWDKSIVATCLKNEGMTGKERRFVVFDKLETGVAFLINRIEAKGIYIGENVDSAYYKGTVTTPTQLAVAYWDEWVMGNNSKPSTQFISDFTSMYNQAKKLFL
ncbi:hypothetical protein UFOVP129_11 [uncultured Caudovirales phage]|uniref:Uncharacterized protein n=1 Tax=uncultured Caudovirales phage TaxID=2100421 RepID=A0A6J5L9G9_9CAUD|nr:hypothetical protein UFOVP129_11 [uncultured Caudovirales phage]